MSKNKVLDKIRKLMSLAADGGATQAEIENALAQAEKLRKKHQIDLSEVEISPSDIDYEYVFMDTKTYEPTHWIPQLSQIIAYGYNCTLHRHKKANGKMYVRIIGFVEDVEICESVIFSTKNIIREMTDMQFKINGKTKDFRKNYMLGFLTGLEERLTKERKEKFAIEAEAQKYDLIVVKKEELINNYIDDTFKNLKNGRRVTNYITNGEAYSAGIKDGKQRNYNTKALKN